MSANGASRARRIEMLGAAEPREAAAVVAAVERFLDDTAPASRPDEVTDPWQRAALLEGVRSREGFASPWGEPRTWGRQRTQAPDL